MQQEVQSVSLITYNIHKGFGVGGAVRFLLPKMRDAITSFIGLLILDNTTQPMHLSRGRVILQPRGVGLVP